MELQKFLYNVIDKFTTRIRMNAFDTNTKLTSKVFVKFDEVVDCFILRILQVYSWTQKNSQPSRARACVPCGRILIMRSKSRTAPISSLRADFELSSLPWRLLVCFAVEQCIQKGIFRFVSIIPAASPLSVIRTASWLLRWPIRPCPCESEAFNSG